MAANHQHLRAFHAIATMGGVSRAARHLNVSQPTLSQQLKALETRHGVSLFEGRKTPFKLTPAGRDLFVLTQRMFKITGDIDSLLETPGGVSGGLLRLGSDNPFHAARIVNLFRQRHPQTDIQVRMGNCREVMRWLSEAQIDAALASNPPADGAFSYQRLASEHLTCALPGNHELAELDIIPIARLRQETLLVGEPTSHIRTFTERALADAGIVPHGTIELHSREIIREAIALGLGVGVFAASECTPDPRLAYRALGPPGRDYVLHVYLICHAHRKRSDLMRAAEEATSEYIAYGKTLDGLDRLLE